MLQVLYTETLNRAIITGSVIVGIAVMMSISMIAPAFASPPWKDVYKCTTSTVYGIILGSYDWVTLQQGCEEITLDDNRVKCDLKRGTKGHMEFKDLNTYNGKLDLGEQKRCHKN